MRSKPVRTKRCVFVPPPLPVAPGRLMLRTAECYHQNLMREPAAFAWLKERGLHDPDLIRNLRPGWCDGRLIAALPEDGTLLTRMEEMGLLRPEGTCRVECFENSIVLPVCDPDGAVMGFWGVRVTDGAIQTTSNCPALWNLPAAKRFARVFLTSSILDGLALYAAGMLNVLAMTNGTLAESDAAALKLLGVQQLDLLFQPAEGLRRVFRSIPSAWLDTRADPLTLLRTDGPAKVAAALEGAPRVALNAAVPSEDAIQPIPGGFAVMMGARRYEILGLCHQRSRMKAALRLEHDGRLFVDTIDFYSARERKRLAAGLAAELHQPPHQAEADVDRLMRICERKEDAEPPASSGGYVMSRQEREDAETFGRRHDLMEQISADYRACGLVGEENNKLLCYLAAVSRKLTHPISVLILSSSGAGKSTLQDAILAFCPPEDVVHLTSLTGRALYYKGRLSLKHKILALEESAGAQHASYAIRNLISAGELVIETTVRDQATGQLTTVQNRVEGPTSVFVTTTDPEVDPETASRFLITGVDESREQTRAILEAQRKAVEVVRPCGEERAAVLQRHRNFQRLLRPLRVINPLAQELVFADDRLQSRREQPKFLGLVNAVALLRQMQKTVKEEEAGGYIEVDEEDVRTAYRIAKEIFGHRLEELPRVSLDLLILLEQMVLKMSEAGGCGRDDVRFTRRQVREFTGWAAIRVDRYLKRLIELEYVLVQRAAWNRHDCRLAYAGEGRDGAPFLMGMRWLANETKNSPHHLLTRSSAGIH